jgi:hypothetical protein
MTTLKPIAMGALCALVMSANDPATAIPADSPPLAGTRTEPGPASAPATDRVGFPANYRSKLRLLSVAAREKEPAIITVYGNDLAASVTRTDQLPYPNGSVIVMEFANTLQDSAHQPIRDANGKSQRGEVVHVDVMRRGEGFGAAYGTDRAGEWEFMSYRPDGSYNEPPSKAVSCAACHAQAGAAKDFVYRLRVPPESPSQPSREVRR